MYLGDENPESTNASEKDFPGMLSAREFDEDCGLGRTVAVPHHVPPMLIASEAPHRARLASDDSPATRRMAGLRL